MDKKADMDGAAKACIAGMAIAEPTRVCGRVNLHKTCNIPNNDLGLVALEDVMAANCSEGDDASSSMEDADVSACRIKKDADPVRATLYFWNRLCGC